MRVTQASQSLLSGRVQATSSDTEVCIAQLYSHVCSWAANLLLGTAYSKEPHVANARVGLSP